MRNLVFGVASVEICGVLKKVKRTEGQKRGKERETFVVCSQNKPRRTSASRSFPEPLPLA